MTGRWFPMRGQPADELQGREAKLGRAVGLRPGQAIDELVLAHLLQALQCEGRARAIAKQPLPPRAVLGFDAHRGLEREAASVAPARHVARLGGVEEAGTHEPARRRFTTFSLSERHHVGGKPHSLCRRSPLTAGPLAG